MAEPKKQGRKSKSKDTTAKATGKQSTLFDNFLPKKAPVIQPDEPLDSAETATSSDVDVMSQDPVSADVNAAESLPSPPPTQPPPLTPASVFEQQTDDDEVPPTTPIHMSSVHLEQESSSPLHVEDLKHVTEFIDIDDVPSSPPAPLPSPPPTFPKGDGSEDAPIVVDSSPVRPDPPKLHPLFRAAKSTVPERPDTHVRKKLKLSHNPTASTSAILPGLITQHVRGPQTKFVTSKLSSSHLEAKPIRPSAAVASPDAPSHLSFSSHPSEPDRPSSEPELAPPAESLEDRKRFLETLPASHRLLNRAISRFSDLSQEPPDSRALDGSQLSWTEKWRPRCADEVLGNEEHARYLRDWMSALRLHLENTPTSTPGGSQTSSQGNRKRKSTGGRSKASKQPRILREVERNIDEEDFIVAYGDEDSEESEASCLPTADRSTAARPNRFGSTIHNTILLHGPSGSGKTAAVFACAEELGYEVFEVYPGIGKRGGVHLDRLIGDVGKNHLVQQAHQAHSGVKPKLKRLRRKESSPDQTNETEPLPAVDSPHSASFRQSVILFEEVDVIFREDGAFWSAAINFIKDCKRPVIMTCNDLSSVPRQDLPLQTTITFSLPDRPLAASYLRTLCATEGHLLSDEQCLDFLHLRSSRPPEQPNNTVSSSQSLGVDIRQSINQCQSMLPSTTVRSWRAIEADADLERESLFDDILLRSSTADIESLNVAQALEVFREESERLSFSDAHILLSRPYDYDSREGHADDQVRYDGTFDATSSLRLPVLSEFYRTDVQMTDCLVDLQRRRSGYSESLTGAIALDCPKAHSVRIQDALRRTIREGELTLCSASIFLDYEPWVRYMVRVAETDVKGRGKGRQTKNSQKVGVGSGWVGTERGAVVDAGLRMDWDD